MKTFNPYLLSIALCFCSFANAQVVINEIMQSNVDCIMDDLNDFPDSWVELYNAGQESVNLADYRLGDSTDAASAWSLPNQSLAPGEYRLVYCDKVADGWHTPYRLESGKGCALFLFKGEEIIDQLPSDMKKQPAPNIAYGRKTDGANKWGYQLTPTPAAENCGKICSNKDILGLPVFSIKGNIYTPDKDKLRLKLSVPDDAPEGTVIRYTEDGSEPTEESTLYTSIIRVTDTKIIRAKLFCDGYLSPRSATQSYLFIDHDVTLPVISIATDRSYLYDEKIGIYVEGSYGGKKNYEYNWRRPINFEYFEVGGEESVLNQLGEARVTGGASRGAALKSLGIYANKRFGEKRLSYEFFPDQRPGKKDFKSVMLRNAGNDFDYLYMRDAVIQRLMSSYVDLDWQAYSPAIVFINGEYKGMLNIRERSNEDNIYTNYEGLEDITMIENNWELKEGLWSQWEEFKNYYNEHGHSWDEYNQRMDVMEYLNVMILNLFFCNLDFPGNNIVFWRPIADGGRWRVVVKDTDFGLGLYGCSPDYKIFKWLYNPNYDGDRNWGANGYEATRLFRRLMEDETFNREFIDRFAIYMGDFMNFDRTWEIWEPMYEKIKYEYPIHRALFNRWWPNYSEELEKAKKWLKDRVEKMYAQIDDYYHVGTPVPLTINKTLSEDEREGISVKMNGVKLSHGMLNGKFFAGRQITIEGENVEGWEVTEIHSNGPNKINVEGNTYTFNISSDWRAVTITAKLFTDGIEDINADENRQGSAFYDLSGCRRKTLSKGMNIVRDGNGSGKIILSSK